MARYSDISIILRSLGILGLFLNSYSHFLLSIICIELIFFGINLYLVFSSLIVDDMSGELFALFVLTLAAAESALALAILTAYFRVFKAITV